MVREPVRANGFGLGWRRFIRRGKPVGYRIDSLTFEMEKKYGSAPTSGYK